MSYIDFFKSSDLQGSLLRAEVFVHCSYNSIKRKKKRKGGKKQRKEGRRKVLVLYIWSDVKAPTISLAWFLRTLGSQSFCFMKVPNKRLNGDKKILDQIRGWSGVRAAEEMFCEIDWLLLLKPRWRIIYYVDINITVNEDYFVDRWAVFVSED